MTSLNDEYDCRPDADGNQECELETGRFKRSASGCWDGASAVDTALSMAKPIVDVEPMTGTALRTAGCAVGVAEELSKPEKKLFID